VVTDEMGTDTPMKVEDLRVSSSNNDSKGPMSEGKNSAPSKQEEKQ